VEGGRRMGWQASERVAASVGEARQRHGHGADDDVEVCRVVSCRVPGEEGPLLKLESTGEERAAGHNRLVCEYGREVLQGC